MHLPCQLITGFGHVFLPPKMTDFSVQARHLPAEHPTAAWTAQQLLEACGLDEEPRYLLRDRHLKRVLSSYVTYYHGARTHLSLVKDAPDGREVQTIEKGRVVELNQVGGLHHSYTRAAA